MIKKQNRKLINESSACEFTRSIEKGWWSSEEAICMFLGNPIDLADKPKHFAQLIASPDGAYITKLVNAAVRDGSIKNHIIEPQFWSNRAPCKDWLEWALTKPSIQLDPMLLTAVGIETNKDPRSKESYRPKDEPMIESSFIAVTKVILYLCPQARLKDIEKIVKNSKAVPYLPSHRTLRKWLAQAKIVLYPNKQTDAAIDEIEKKARSVTSRMRLN